MVFGVDFAGGGGSTDKPPAAATNIGLSALALVVLVLVRVPVMNFCVGQDSLTVEGVALTCLPNWDALLQLLRFDVNRYVIPLAPFAVLGIPRADRKINEYINKPKILDDQNSTIYLNRRS